MRWKSTFQLNKTIMSWFKWFEMAFLADFNDPTDQSTPTKIPINTRSNDHPFKWRFLTRLLEWRCAVFSQYFEVYDISLGISCDSRSKHSWLNSMIPWAFFLFCEWGRNCVVLRISRENWFFLCGFSEMWVCDFFLVKWIFLTGLWSKVG